MKCWPPGVSARVLAVAVLLSPPRDWGGGYGSGEKKRYVYQCETCEKIRRVTVPFEDGEEPPCRADRRHGPVTLRWVE